MQHMSAEELAKLITSGVSCAKCIKEGSCCRTDSCITGVTKWLNQEEKPVLPENIKKAVLELATYCNERSCDVCYFKEGNDCKIKSFKDTPDNLYKLIGR